MGSRVRAVGSWQVDPRQWSSLQLSNRSGTLWPRRVHSLALACFHDKWEQSTTSSTPRCSVLPEAVNEKVLARGWQKSSEYPGAGKGEPGGGKGVHGLLPWPGSCNT